MTCGGGEQNRLRSCDNPPPEYGGKPCPGERQEIRLCNEFPCAGRYSDAHLSCSISHTRVGLSRSARKVLELSCSWECQNVAINSKSKSKSKYDYVGKIVGRHHANFRMLIGKTILKICKNNSKS